MQGYDDQNNNSNLKHTIKVKKLMNKLPHIYNKKSNDLINMLW